MKPIIVSHKIRHKETKLMLLSKFSINIEFDKRIDNKEEVIDHRDKLIEDIETGKKIRFIYI